MVLAKQYSRSCQMVRNCKIHKKNECRIQLLWMNKPDLTRPGPEVIKLFSCSTQLSMKFFLLINVKMPTIVGILTFMSRKNSILHLSEPDKSWISWYFYAYEHLKFHAQLSWAQKKFYNLGPRSWCFFYWSKYLFVGLYAWKTQHSISTKKVKTSSFIFHHVCQWTNVQNSFSPHTVQKSAQNRTTRCLMNKSRRKG